MGLVSRKTISSHNFEEPLPVEGRLAEPRAAILQDVDQELAQSAEVPVEPISADDIPEAPFSLSATHQDSLPQTVESIVVPEPAAASIPEKKYASRPRTSSSSSSGFSLFKITKRRVEALVVVAIIGLSGYVWLTHHVAADNASPTDVSSQADTAPTPTDQPEVTASGGAAQEQNRMNAVQAVSRALAACVSGTKTKKFTTPCNTLDGLTKGGYLTADPTGTALAVSDDQRNAISYTKLTALTLQCEIGSGTSRYFVYRSQTGYYHIECLDSDPTP